MPFNQGPDAAAAELQRYRTILNSIDQGFCVAEVLCDAEGRPADYRFLTINTAFEHQTGLKNAVGRGMRELAPDLEQHWYDIYGQVALTGQATRFVQEARPLGGRWFDVYAFRLGDPALRQVAILFTDVTARVRAERGAQMLVEVSESLLSLAREADLPAIVRQHAGRYFRLSQCSFAEIDLERELAFIPTSWDDPSAPPVGGVHRLADYVAKDLWQELSAGQTVVIENIATAPHIKGRERFEALQVRSFVAVPLLRTDKVWQVMILGRAEPGPWPPDEVALARELAARCWSRVERLRVEVNMRTSEERLRLILENAREYAIISMDLERRITTWSAGAECLLGHRADEMVGQLADRIFIPEDQRSGAPMREAETAIREGRAADERWHQRKDGSRFWGSGSMMAMRDADGVAWGLLKIMRDQTDVRLAQEALVRSQSQLQEALQIARDAGEAKDRFLATLSHELRTPLNPVLMIAEDRSTDPSVPPDMQEDFVMIKRNIEHEARLIDDMLDLSRIVRGKIPLRRSDVDLHEVLREVVRMVQGAAGEKRIKLTTRLFPEGATVQGDPARLRQVFLNLLNNAIKFTPLDGAIALATRRPAGDREVEVEITDTGLGMTEEELARAFEPFSQGSHASTSSASPSFGGLGLGLAIVRDLVERHGGRVAARSRGQGLGATFVVNLPLARQ